MSRFPPPVPFPPQEPPQRRRTDERLVAAGSMVLVEALLTVGVGLLALMLAYADGPWFEQTKEQHVRSVALGIGLIVFGVVLLWSGVAAIRGRHWARITIIVVQPLLVLRFVADAATSRDIDGAVTVIVIGWAVTSFSLAVTSRTTAP